MKHRISDEDLDRLLAARVREWPADFPQRVATRIAEETAGPRPRRQWVWYLLPALAAAGFAVLLTTVHETPAATPEDFETLFALEDSLAPARPLLDPVNRELCAELPLDPHTP